MSRASRLNDLRQLLRARNRQAFGRATPPADPAGIRGIFSSLQTPGGVSEWISAIDGCGAAELAFAIARKSIGESDAVPPSLLIVDPAGEISPTALEQRGWDLSRVVCVRSKNPAEALWGVEQGLRSGGVDFVWCRLPRLTPVAFRRLKLAAEAGGSQCLLMRSPEALGETSWADARFLVSSFCSPAWSCRRVRVEVLKLRNNLPGAVVHLELDYETGVVRLVSELADSTDLPRAAGA